MATLEDVFNLGYDITEAMRIGDPPKFGKPDTRHIIWSVSGYGTFTYVDDSNQDMIDALADPQPPMRFLLSRDNPDAGTAFGQFPWYGWEAEITSVTGFPENGEEADGTTAVVTLTDPDGEVEESVPSGELPQRIADIQQDLAERAAAEQEEPAEEPTA